MKCLFVSSRSCTILQDAEGDYYAKASRRLFLNNQELPEENRSVFSLFGLWPNTEYTLKAILNDETEEEISFHTEKEIVSLDVRRFGATGDGERTILPRCRPPSWSVPPAEGC